MGRPVVVFVGTKVGELDKNLMGRLVIADGLVIGELDGLKVGDEVGVKVGILVGILRGESLVDSIGAAVLSSLGISLRDMCDSVGAFVGETLGNWVRSADGVLDGDELSIFIG